MIIRRMQPQDEAEVLRMSVTEDQERYAGNIREILNDLTEHQDCHLIEVEGTIVGFFIIDRAYPEQYEFSVEGEIGFRAYFIDQSHQSKGYGKASVLALRDYLRETYSEYPAVVLTVNCRNDLARNLYLAGGFVDMDELYHGGNAGPQHILRMQLA